MIITALVGLLGIVLYFVGTCAYTARQQDALRDQLAADNPELAAAELTVAETDFIALDAVANTAAAVERQEQLLALKTAAEEYHKKILGRVGKAVGRIAMPKIGVDVVMVEGNFEGFSDAYLRKGPGHWPETPLPGEGGGVVVSGHRTTYGAPFRQLDELVAGDEIQLVMPYAIIRYTVTLVVIVGPDDVEVVAERGLEEISLVACHPLSYSSQRIIAQGFMSSFVLLESGQ